MLKFVGNLRMKIEMGVKLEGVEILTIHCGAFGPSHIYVSQTAVENHLGV